MKQGPYGSVALVVVLLAFAAMAPGASARVPEVRVVPHSPELAYLLYPEFYPTREDAAADTTYREASIQEAIDYWNTNGSRILSLVSELSGIKWREKTFPLYLVEETPSWGSPDPLILPLQYWRRGDVVRIAAVGDARGFVLASLLAQRIFMQVPASKQPAAFGHPLFQRGYGTRDNMANIVAYWTMASLVGEDKALEVILNSGMVAESPGLKLVAESFLPGWRLTKKKPLVKWVESEPVDSELVKKALGVRAELGLGPMQGRKTGLVVRSHIDLRTRVTADGEVVVVAVGPGGLAEQGEFRPGDILARVGGVTVANSRDVMGRLIAILRQEGRITVEVERDGELSEHYMNMDWIKPKSRS